MSEATAKMQMRSAAVLISELHDALFDQSFTDETLVKLLVAATPEVVKAVTRS